MKHNIAFTTVLVLIAVPATVARAADGFQAFPGAEGFGARSIGGRGGHCAVEQSARQRPAGAAPETQAESEQVIGPLKANRIGNDLAVSRRLNAP